MNVQTLYVEITNRCNMNCRSCYNRSGLNKQTVELSLQQLEQMITLFSAYGLKRFLFSGGEPTLHSQWESILDLTSRYPHLSFGMVTNGTTHSEKLIEYLNTRDNLSIQLSLDGSCEAYNALTRGSGHFEKALAFARKIHNPHSTMKMVVSRCNLPDVEDFCRLALSLGFTPELTFLCRSGNGAEHWDERQLTHHQKLQVLKLADRIAKEHHAPVLMPLCSHKCPYVEGLKDLSLCVKSDGAIQPCQMMYDSAYSLGNALSFDEEDFLGKLKAFSALARERSTRDYHCDRCLLNGHCGKGCMAEAWNAHQDPLANDESCQYRKLQFLYYELPKLTSGKGETL